MIPVGHESLLPVVGLCRIGVGQGIAAEVVLLRTVIVPACGNRQVVTPGKLLVPTQALPQSVSGGVVQCLLQHLVDVDALQRGADGSGEQGVQHLRA